jgi:hypothetical protein
VADDWRFDEPEHNMRLLAGRLGEPGSGLGDRKALQPARRRRFGGFTAPLFAPARALVAWSALLAAFTVTAVPVGIYESEHMSAEDAIGTGSLFGIISAALLGAAAFSLNGRMLRAGPIPSTLRNPAQTSWPQFPYREFNEALTRCRERVRLMELPGTVLGAGEDQDRTLRELGQVLRRSECAVEILVLIPSPHQARSSDKSLSASLAMLNQFRLGLSRERRGRLRVWVGGEQQALGFYRVDGRVFAGLRPSRAASASESYVEIPLTSLDGRNLNQEFENQRENAVDLESCLYGVVRIDGEENRVAYVEYANKIYLAVPPLGFEDSALMRLLSQPDRAEGFEFEAYAMRARPCRVVRLLPVDADAALAVAARAKYGVDFPLLVEFAAAP